MINPATAVSSYMPLTDLRKIKHTDFSSLLSLSLLFFWGGGGRGGGGGGGGGGGIYYQVAMGLYECWLMCHTGMWHTVGGRGWIFERALCPTVWDWGIGEGIRLVEWAICMRWEGVATKNTRGGWVKVCIVVYDTHFHPSRLDSGRRRRESSLCIHRGATRGGWIRMLLLLLLFFSIFSCRPGCCCCCR